MLSASILLLSILSFDRMILKSRVLSNSSQSINSAFIAISVGLIQTYCMVYKIFEYGPAGRV